MPLETPLLRVSRPVAACSRCRAAKIKCDGKLPACTACERANKASECSSTNDQFAKGKERSYVATLENRVEKLQQKINETRERRKSSLAMMEPGVWSPRRISVDANGRPKDRRAAKRKELSDIDELVSDFGFLAVNATTRDFYGFTSAMSYSRLVLAASQREVLPAGMRKELPPRYAATSLIQHYINHIQVALPILDEASFYGSVDNVYNPDPRQASSFDHWIVRLVLAIAAAAQSQQRGDTHYSDAIGHICGAIGYAEHVLHPGSIWSIQAMLLLVVYAMLDPNHFDSWTLVGAAARSTVDLGLHQDPSKSLKVGRDKLELRRRVFYCVYALDRSTSLVQTRAFSFSDDSINAGLPFQSKAMSPPSSPDNKSNMWLPSFDAALDLIKFRQIQSAWYTNLFQSGRTPWADPYSYIWKMYNDMGNWFNNLSQSTQPTVRDFFELDLLYSYVYILSPSPRCPEPSEHAQRLIFEHCISYSGKMLHFTTESPSTKRSPLTFYDCLRVYMTGRHFVDVLTNNFDGLLRPGVPTPSSFSSHSMDAEVDPLAPTGVVQPPPLPVPSAAYDLSAPDANTPVARAISALNDFISVLSYFGVRFGYVGGISWRDHFQRESHPLLSQLQQRAQQQKQMDQGFSAWPGSAGQARSSTSAGLSPGATTAYYPSPPNSHYSPEYARSESGRSVSSQWPAVGSVGEMDYQMPMQPVAGDASLGQTMAPGNVHDLGIGSLTAWQTLPGGSLNARFT